MIKTPSHQDNAPTQIPDDGLVRRPPRPPKRIVSDRDSNAPKSNARITCATPVAGKNATMAMYNSGSTFLPPAESALPAPPMVALLDKTAGLGSTVSSRISSAQKYVPAAPNADHAMDAGSARGMEARADQVPTGTPTASAVNARLAKVLHVGGGSEAEERRGCEDAK